MNNPTQEQQSKPFKVQSCSNPLLKERFKLLLLQKKAKQIELARYCGLSKSMMSMICSGYYEPELRLKLKIAEFFGCDSQLIWREQQR